MKISIKKKAPYLRAHINRFRSHASVWLNPREKISIMRTVPRLQRARPRQHVHAQTQSKHKHMRTHVHAHADRTFMPFSCKCLTKSERENLHDENIATFAERASAPARTRCASALSVAGVACAKCECKRNGREKHNMSVSWELRVKESYLNICMCACERKKFSVSMYPFTSLWILTKDDA